MAKQDFSQYRMYYTDGSAARQIEFKPRKTLPEQPKRPRQKKILIRVDFLAVAGIVVATVLLVLMMVGVNTLVETSRQVEQLENYVSQLEADNAKLESSYHAGYDPVDVRQRALAMGLLPAEQAQTVPIHLEEPAVVEETQNLFSKAWSFFTGLFA